jgi:hypothetical protein
MRWLPKLTPMARSAAGRAGSMETEETTVAWAIDGGMTLVSLSASADNDFTASTDNRAVSLVSLAVVSLAVVVTMRRSGAAGRQQLSAAGQRERACGRGEEKTDRLTQGASGAKAVMTRAVVSNEDKIVGDEESSLVGERARRAGEGMCNGAERDVGNADAR